MGNKVLVFALAATLLPTLTLSARTKKKNPQEWAAFEVKLSKDKQIQHALERLTFGPATGDYERVRKIGLKKWIDLELHPERIKENPVLAAKLKPLESLQMTSLETVQHYPTQQMIQAVASGRAPLPDDPELRAVVRRLAERYKQKRFAKDQAESPKESKTTTFTKAVPDETEPAVPIEQLLDAGQMKILRNGTSDQKKAVLRLVPTADFDSLVVALPRNLRQQLYAFAPTDLRRQMLLSTAPQQVIAHDLWEGKLYRAIYSKRQLTEELSDFWYNHFNVYLDKGADRYFVPSYEREAVRPHILGKFHDLLLATAESPAMLFYLDNWQSVAPPQPDQQNTPKGRVAAANKRPPRGLNENYARELLELHTLGVDGGYTQKDIIEVARCFTGWTILDPRKGGTFEFNNKTHDQGEKVVLGVTIPEGGGQEDGRKVLDILEHHPSTARFISRKLAQRFVADNPPPALIDRMAKTFHDKDGDIREVMRTMLSSKEFWSEGAYHAKVKTPFEMVVSAVRALDADVDYAFGLGNQIQVLGQPLYRKQEPTGYSSTNAEWVNSGALLARMNFALSLAQNKLQGVKVDTSRFADAAKDDPMKIAKALLFRDASPRTRAAIETALQQTSQKNGSKQAAQLPGVIAGLVIGSPEFQRR